MTLGTSHQEICKESQIMTIRFRHAALRGFMMTILMTAPLSAYAREDHAPTNPRYETKILTDKAEYLTHTMIVQIKDGHWTEVVKDARKIAEIGKQIQAINAY
ncbi:conserved protein of unknown function [Acidithiobacillus ferrivorans]|jgi:hypothetical protein|uniref:Uncharacterized protein n=10 Tax=root TaxID=1 RepID=A0A3M8QTW1_9PROT|nr:MULTISPECIES: hypothetical protein [Acidithiobacillus]AEM47077.1 hypothetical protein Acife_0899 [Acidithiobacillus ferrivorans SS3]MBU2724079.1 hypothetical protein [Acidithiobacillus ferridurans]MBU2727644.1 hypothetical protein [Acidithiobacillus ferridurans]MBU2767515.1 hypothetical protein [Acidithiobacillus ferrivorans]MBU2784642.1 hypothetical protein [Acidithiobacillus ferriphilus]